MINAIAINSSYPQIGRYPCRTLVASINATLINLASQDIRMRSRTMVEAAGVEAPTEAELELEQQAETTQRLEQGLVVPMPPLEQAALLKVVRDEIAADLLKHATVTYAEHKGQRIRVYNQFDLGLTVEETLDFRIKAEPPVVSQAEIDALVKALKVTKDEVLMAKAAQHKTDVTFLVNHREDILQTLDGLHCDEEFAENAFDKLPVITQLRLYAAALRGIGKGRQSELRGFIQNRPEAAGNMTMLDSLARTIWGKVDRFEAAPANKAAITEAHDRGASLPTFPVRPAPLEGEAPLKFRKAV